MDERVKRIMDENIIVDALFHTLLKDEPPECNTEKNIIDMILEGGVNCIASSIIDDDHPIGFKDLCVEVYDHDLLRDCFPDKLLVVDKFEDIEKAKKEGKLALIYSI